MHKKQIHIPKPTCRFKNRSHVCTTLLLYTIQHKTVLVIFPPNLQKIIIAIAQPS